MSKPPAAAFNLSEIFAAAQGEGFYLGEPCIFIRSSGCNLRCQWGDTPCDTPHASWQAEQRPRSVSDIMAEVRALAARYPIRHAVITGGEPLLQPALPDLVKALRRRRFFIALETNGTLYRELDVDFVSISPKLTSSAPRRRGGKAATGPGGSRLDLGVLRQWLRRHECQLKFVVNRPADEAEIGRITAALGDLLPRQRVYLMPQGVTARQVAAKARLCLAIALRRGWRYTPRAHIEVFGNRRGT